MIPVAAFSFPDHLTVIPISIHTFGYWSVSKTSA